MLASLILTLSTLLSPSATHGPVAPAADPVPVLPDDADVNVDYDLVVDLADSEIDVDMEVDITYTKPSERDGNRIIRYSMVEWHSFLPSSADDLVVSDPDGPLDFQLEDVDQPGVVLVMVDFRRDLSAGDSLRLSLSYSLPSEPPPIELDESVGLILEDQVVVNEAAVGWAFYSDPRADAWTAEVVLPPGFVGPVNDDGSESDRVWRQTAGSRTLMASGDEFLYDFIILENDAAMREDSVPFDGHEITVRHWPGDTAWRDGVSEQITDNLPTLIDLVGRDWPDRRLVLQQSAQTLGTSYGGWYTSGDHRITIGRSINPELVLHELSHVWFHYDNLADRWLIEGLADEFAGLAAHGPDGEPGPEVSADDELAISLKEWTDPDSVSDPRVSQPEAERWAYQAAWHVVRTTRETIGVEAFSEITRSILGDGRSYSGADDPVEVMALGDTGGAGPLADLGARSWREFLDLASEHDEDERLPDLYATWVEGGWTPEFEQRASSRGRYEQLEQRARQQAGLGRLPAAVRDPMRTWDFDEAEEAMDVTDGFLDQVDSIGAQLAARSMPLPADLGPRAAVLASAEEIVDYQETLVNAADDVGQLVDRAEAVDRWQRVGLVASDFDDQRVAATEAFTAGDFERSTQLVGDAEETLAGARDRGLRRVGSAAGLLAVLGLVAAVIWRRRHRRPPGSGDGAITTLMEQCPSQSNRSIIDLTDSEVLQ